ncbi:MAG: AEC family transporter [Caldilineaceae bacterium]
MSQLLSIFLNILGPVFVLVLIGYVTGPRLKLEASTLSRFAYYLVTPAFTFNIFSAAEIRADLALRMALFIVAVTGATVLVAWLVARLLRCPPKMTSAYVLAAAFGNVGNFGLPIVQFKLGDDALVAASFYFLVLSFFGFVVGVMAATWHQGTGLRSVGAAFKTPAVLAVIPAFLVNYFDLPLPLFVPAGSGAIGRRAHSQHVNHPGRPVGRHGDAQAEPGRGGGEPGALAGGPGTGAGAGAALWPHGHRRGRRHHSGEYAGGSAGGAHCPGTSPHARLCDHGGALFHLGQRGDVDGGAVAGVV